MRPHLISELLRKQSVQELMAEFECEIAQDQITLSANELLGNHLQSILIKERIVDNKLILSLLRLELCG